MKQLFVLLIAALSRAYGRGSPHGAEGGSTHRKEVENAVSSLSSLVSGRRSSGLVGKDLSFSLLASKDDEDEKESSEKDEEEESGGDDDDEGSGEDDDDDEEGDDDEEDDEDEEDIGDAIKGLAAEKIADATGAASEMGQEAAKMAAGLPQVQAAAAAKNAMAKALPFKLF